MPGVIFSLFLLAGDRTCHLLTSSSFLFLEREAFILPFRVMKQLHNCTASPFHTCSMMDGCPPLFPLDFGFSSGNVLARFSS